MIYAIILGIISAIFTGFTANFDKQIAKRGITKEQYTFYNDFALVLFLLPFINYNNLFSKFNLIVAILLAIVVIIRIVNAFVIININKEISPFEFKFYSSFKIFIVYIIDVYLGNNKFELKLLLSSLLVILAIYMLLDEIKKTKRKPSFKVIMNIIIKIVCEISSLYVISELLKYFTIWEFIFIRALLVSIVYSFKGYKINLKNKHIKMGFILMFVSQLFGIWQNYFNAKAISINVTGASIGRTTSILFISIFSALMFKTEKMNIKKIFLASILICLSVLVIKLL